MELFHGSSQVVRHPLLKLGKPNNDYGQGFYCTPDKDLACEWACPSLSRNGVCNCYSLDSDGLVAIDLDKCENGVFGWIATLMKNRPVDYRSGANRQAIQRFIETYAIDLSGVDLVSGYRADDAYFEIVRSFANNQIPVERLEECLRLGDLGRQVMLRTDAALEALEFVGALNVESGMWNAKRVRRNSNANAVFKKLTSDEDFLERTFFVDVLRSM